jgi:hypothetical protein
LTIVLADKEKEREGNLGAGWKGRQGKVFVELWKMDQEGHVEK